MNDNDQEKRKKSIDFKLRLQALEDTTEGVVLSYLNSLGPRSSKDLIWQVLRMCYLPFAYREKGNLSKEELRIIALEACNALENYASYIRQVFFLERPTQQIVIMNGQNSAQAQPLSAPKPESLPEPESKPKIESLIKGVGTQEDMEAIFGDM